MHGTTDSEIAAERQRDEEERRRRRELRHRRSVVTGSVGAAIGTALLVVMFAYALGGVTPPGDAGLTRVLAAILILGGINMRLRSAASLRAEYRWAEQQRVHRVQSASMDAVHSKIDAICGLVAQSVQGSPVAAVVMAQLAEITDRQVGQEETLAKVAERVDVAYTTGFTDGIGHAAG